MNKRQACELLGVNLTGLAKIICMKYDSLRSLKKFSPIHLKLMQWELDKRFVKDLIDKGDDVKEVAEKHMETINQIQRALDS